MDSKEYENIYKNEESHFYYVSTHKLILSLIKKFAPKRANLQILDAGCGTGLLTDKLQVFGNVLGIDKSSEALKFAKKRGVKVKKASVTDLPFRKNLFDVVVSIDVIHHQWVESDDKALEEFFRVLRPNGILLIRVPAVKWLSLSHDKYVQTARRYDKQELKQKLLKSGFKIEKLTFVNMLLLPVAIFKHFWEKISPPEKPSSNIGSLSNFINKIVGIDLSFETYLLGKINLPFGLGLLCVGRKDTKK